MLPEGFAGVEAQLWVWMVALIRPGAAFVAAPVFGASNVPVQLRLVIALAVGIPGLQTTGFVLPADGLASIEGFALVAGEVLAGLAIDREELADERDDFIARLLGDDVLEFDELSTHVRPAVRDDEVAALREVLVDAGAVDDADAACG